jgi:hypothetical protein
MFDITLEKDKKIVLENTLNYLSIEYKGINTHHIGMISITERKPFHKKNERIVVLDSIRKNYDLDLNLKKYKMKVIDANDKELNCYLEGMNLVVYKI